MGKYFGTDGIRGIANVELDSELALKIGRAIGKFLLKNNTTRGLVAIGKDNRLSGDMIEHSIISGLVSVGLSTVSLGVIPTPAVSRLITINKFIAGIVISASHNPVEDNGIKLFNSNGCKFDETEESIIEEYIDFFDKSDLVKNNEIGKAYVNNNAVNLYLDSVYVLFKDLDLKGQKIFVDCANGSTSYTTPQLLSRLGAEVISINSNHDGEKINVNCGSTNLGFAIDYAVQNKVDFGFGFAHDGDGDRVIGFLNNGKIIDGDIMLTLCALYRKKKSTLKNNLIIGTTMTNAGIECFLNENGIKFFRSDVGDRYVYKDMVRLSADLGGEQSGHLIFFDKGKTGDGLITILEFLRVIIDKDLNLINEIEKIKFYDQTLLNVKVSDKSIISNSQILKDKIDSILSSEEYIRINVRPSGTEPLIRILVEAPEKHICDKYANEIKKTVDMLI